MRMVRMHVRTRICDFVCVSLYIFANVACSFMNAHAYIHKNIQYLHHTDDMRKYLRRRDNNAPISGETAAGTSTINSSSNSTSTGGGGKKRGPAAASASAVVTTGGEEEAVVSEGMADLSLQEKTGGSGGSKANGTEA